jgi:hypothetical protein
MDSLRTGSLENVARLKGDSNFDYIDHDTTSYIHLPGELDEIYHFASPASPADFERIPIPILKVGALGTLNSLGLALKKGGSIWQGSGAATRTGKSRRTAAQLRGSLSRRTHSRLASRDESCPWFE